MNCVSVLNPNALICLAADEPEAADGKPAAADNAAPQLQKDEVGRHLTAIMACESYGRNCVVPCCSVLGDRGSYRATIAAFCVLVSACLPS